MVVTGLMTCNTDFCPSCAHAHECDLTCGFCNRRRTQITMECPVADFPSRVDAVNAACCNQPDPSALLPPNCDAGVPTTCDALCASVFLDFYSSCHRILDVSVAPADAMSYNNLFATCGKCIINRNLVLPTASVNDQILRACARQERDALMFVTLHCRFTANGQATACPC